MLELNKSHVSLIFLSVLGQKMTTTWSDNVP